MDQGLPHERLDVYALYLETASLCGDIIAGINSPYVALDHLDRAFESIGTNLIRANGQAFGSPQRRNSLTVSIGSTHECGACLDALLAKGGLDRSTYSAGISKLWRIRGMLLGLRRATASEVRDGEEPYGSSQFPFASLDVYQTSLKVVTQVHGLSQEADLRARVIRKLDNSTTGTVLNIAEGHGRESLADQNRFLRTAHQHACQALLTLDLMAARKETSVAVIADRKTTLTRVIKMLYAWSENNLRRIAVAKGS